jgi:hypothetical protein
MEGPTAPPPFRFRTAPAAAGTRPGTWGLPVKVGCPFLLPGTRCCRLDPGGNPPVQTLLRAEQALTRRELAAALQTRDEAHRALVRAEAEGRSERADELRADIAEADADIQRLFARLAQLTAGPAIAAGRPV